jgi:hypothetical protein
MKKKRKIVKIKRTEDLVKIKEKECDLCGSCITGCYGYYVEVNGRRATKLHCIGCIDSVKEASWGRSRPRSSKELIILNAIYSQPLCPF